MLASALAGCTGGAVGPVPAAPETSSPAPTLDARPFFVAGETITWEVSFAGVAGGRARLAVGDVGSEGGRKLVVLRAEAESAGVIKLIAETRDTLSSWIDVDSGLPARTEGVSAGGGKPYVVKATRVPGKAVAEVHLWSDKTGDEGTIKTAKLPSPSTHDPLSALLALRGWAAPPGGRAEAYSLGGMRVWRNEFAVEAREVIEGPLGKRSAIRIRGTSRRLSATLGLDTTRPPRTFVIWLTDDDQHIPIRFSAHTEVGDVVANLTSYTN